MITEKDWKEYTKQIDARNEKRSKRDLKEIERFYKDAEKRREQGRIAHEIRERNNKELARERGEFYFEEIYWPTFEFAPIKIYANDRTFEACMDWIVKGRPKITFK